ncbi:MAG: hypothetical protein IT448_07990 [Phycisphaerales bacterium]|nr:hypothetical protein [Phycisphaerales bacterium]
MGAMTTRDDDHDHRIELEPSRTVRMNEEVDRRPRIPEPLPVRLIAISDVDLPAAQGQESHLDQFYVELLEFARCQQPNASEPIRVYQSDSHCLRLRLQEPVIHRQDYRPAVIQIRSLDEMQRKLVDRQIEHVRQKSVAVGYESLSLQDPAGNWLELVEAREVG